MWACVEAIKRGAGQGFLWGYLVRVLSAAAAARQRQRVMGPANIRVRERERVFIIAAAESHFICQGSRGREERERELKK
jgi:hypothetical protein